MYMLWLLVPPAGIFTASCLGYFFFKYIWDAEFADQWWVFPTWMVVAVCGIVPIGIGSVMIGAIQFTRHFVK